MKREVFPRRAEVAAGACVAAITAMAALTISAAAQQQKIGAPPESMNMRLVGYNDLQGRSAYQPTIHHQGNRYIAYIGHRRPDNHSTSENVDPIGSRVPAPMQLWLKLAVPSISMSFSISCVQPVPDTELPVYFTR